MPSRREFIAAIGGVGTMLTTRRGTARTPTTDPPTTAWTRTYPASSGFDAIHPVNDGYVLVGSRATGDQGYRGFITKTTATGHPKWQQVVGDSTTVLNACASRPDGGVIVAGTTNIREPSPVRDRDRSSDPLIVALDADGHVRWSRTLQPRAGDGSSNAIARIPDGYLVGGHRRPGEDSTIRPWIAQISDDGHQRWARTIEWQGQDGVISDVSTSDEAWYVGGSTASAESSAGWQETAFITRLDLDASTQWQYTLDGRKGSSIAALETDGDGVVAVGNRRFSADDDGTGVHLRVASDGTTEWRHSYSTGPWNWLHGMAAVDDGYLLVGTREQSSGGTSDNGPRGAWVLNTRPSGELHWETTYFDGEYSAGDAIHPLGRTHFLVGGRTHTDDGDAGDRKSVV